MVGATEEEKTSEKCAHVYASARTGDQLEQGGSGGPPAAGGSMAAGTSGATGDPPLTRERPAGRGPPATRGTRGSRAAASIANAEQQVVLPPAHAELDDAPPGVPVDAASPAVAPAVTPPLGTDTPELTPQAVKRLRANPHTCRCSQLPLLFCNA
jgi:hypothetical protein